MKSLSCALLLVFLVACGGGDSDDSDNTLDLNSTINEGNAEKIISDAFSSFDDFNDFDDLFLEQPVQKVNQKISVSSNALAIVYCGEDPETDTGNGFMDVTISGNFITSLNILVQFSLCTFEETVVVDGDYELDFVGDGDIGPEVGDGTNTITQTFTALNISDNTLNTSADISGNVVTVASYQAPIFSWSDTANIDLASNEGSIAFNNWQKSLAFDTETSQLSLNISGSFNATTHGGSFSFEMIEPIVFEAVLIEDEAEASLVLSGQFKLTADDNSSVLVTILSPTQAQLEIDEDGDGQVDITIIVEIEDLDIFDGAES